MDYRRPAPWYSRCRQSPRLTDSRKRDTLDFVLEATTGASDAPHIEVGVYDAVLTALSQEAHPDWAGVDQFGKADTGDRLRWAFQPLEGTGKPVYDEGDRVTVDLLTNLKLNPKAQTKSKGIRILEAILPAADYAAFSAGLKLRDEDVIARPCQVQIGMNDGGWPYVVTVMPPRRGFSPDNALIFGSASSFAGIDKVE